MCVTQIYLKSCFFVRVFVRSVTWLIHVCESTHSYLCRDSADVFGTGDKTNSFVWHDSFICVTWLVHTYAGTQPMYSGVMLSVFGLLIMFRERFVRVMTHLYVWHDSFICQCLCCSSSFASGSCVPWLIPLCDMTHSYLTFCGLLILFREGCACVVTHPFLWHDSSTCDVIGTYRLPYLYRIILQTNPVMYPWLICGRFVEKDLKDNGSSLLQHTATHCNTLQHTATHCNTLDTLQHTATHWNTLQFTATHCNALQHTATHCNTLDTLQYTATHCSTQHTATHCNTLQHTATHCNTLDTLQYTATHCSTLQHTATHCNTLQHTKLRYPMGLGSPVVLSLTSTNNLRMCEGVCVCVCVRVCESVCIAYKSYHRSRKSSRWANCDH